MRSTVYQRDNVAAWDVARPERASRVAGVTMAGFGVRSLTALRMVPHPALTMILEFGAGQPIVDDAAGGQQRGSLVAGLGFGFGGAVLARGENVVCVQVRLSPLIARAVLGASPADLQGAVVSVDDLWGREASRIRERLGEVSSWEERFALTDALLARRNEAASAVDAEVAWAWRRILTGRGLVRVDSLAAEVGWSRKRLWSRFRSQLGMQPKLAAKLVRFDHAVHRLVAGEGAARVAADGGYADQSHLHRDVVAFTGVTPTTVAGEPWLTVDDTAWPATKHPPKARHERLGDR
ncbi:AraC family transcriptional regulator [Actinopolymorpha pittospori]|uniref:AraC-like DNA-binding protein n=1 Tax=Actinopolymorpha pittospori TaxID=648752 RepID=A0A927MMQ9_9ACTN|nr:helix-turn-helix domain-containing protein [Actinopolymorpha pittospori]MBE1603531.1 AraC-like DNA-binding protein [Actinopolymorpha pittospori]